MPGQIEQVPGKRALQGRVQARRAPRGYKRPYRAGRRSECRRLGQPDVPQNRLGNGPAPSSPESDYLHM